MADALTVSLSFILSGQWTDTQDMGTINDVPRFDLGKTLTDGTASIDTADLWWHDERTLAATSETLSLIALTRTVYGSTNTINMARVKGLLIKNVNTSATHKLTVGAASSPWIAWTSVAGSTIYVEPDGILFMWAPTAAGWLTTASNLKIDAGANTIVYRICILGSSA